MKKNIVILLVGLFLSIYVANAQKIEGLVIEQTSEKDKNMLAGANIIWLGTQAGTQTDAKGKFSLAWQAVGKIVVSFTGFRTDTISVEPDSFVEIILQNQNKLQTVEVQATHTQNKEIQNTEILTTKDLKKSACCNLSESFETQNTVDVQTADAVSGTKQIRMLGLDGTYAQIMTENIPNIRGLAAKTGMQYIPGTWIKSIEINKGAGSVANGYESITGQINVELAKPENSERLLFNFFAGDWGRFEANLNLSQKISEKWSTGLLLHTSTLARPNDNNRDGFMDLPQYQQINLVNRWKYKGDNLESQTGIKFLIDHKLGGQINAERNQVRSLQNPYVFWANDAKFEFFNKTAFFLNEKASIGVISHYTYHDKNAAWGLNNYQGRQNYALLNVIYDVELSSKNRLRAGVNLMTDNYNEKYQQNFPQSQLFLRQRNELVAGFFAEYTWKINQKWNIIAGLRQDFHNLMGTFITPRLHTKYAITDNTFVRFSAGRGQRIANVLIENMPYLMSSRSLSIQDNLKPEIAWNYGISFSHLFYIADKKFTFEVDYFRTDFINQIVTDLDYSPQAIRIYNLKGIAYANSLQAELKATISERLNFLVSYKWYEVQNSFINTAQIADANTTQRLLMPFVPQQRALWNIAYSTPKNNWIFDFTTQFWGQRRLPNTQANPSEHQLPAYSPNYWIFNAQVTHNIKNWEIYVGSENIANFMQDMPIIHAFSPFSEHFDGGMVWGPVMGRMIYAGLRFSIK